MTENRNLDVSQFTKDKASRTRIAIESFYAQTVTQCVEREQRARKLEEMMAADGLFVCLLVCLQ